MLPSKEIRVKRAQSGGFARRGNHKAAAEAARDARALTLEQHVRDLVDAAPPLTEEQRARIARILRPDGIA